MLEKLCGKSKRIAREPWHRYAVPGYDGDDDLPEYRFRWELFGEAVFYTSVDMSICPITFCCFSRAKLSDLDLLSLTNELPMTSSSSTDRVLDISESEVKNDEGGYNTEEDIAREMAALDLPLSFGKSKRREQNCRWCKRKYRNYRVREKSPHYECLSDYILCNGLYLERKSWFHDYPESFFSTEAAEKFDKYTDQNCTPYALLKEHEKASAFFGASYSILDHKKGECSGCWFHWRENPIKNQVKESPKDHKMEGSSKDEEKQYLTNDQDKQSTTEDLFKTDNDWNLLYLKHKEIVENRIAKDYDKYKKESNIKRCLEFSDKLASVGLTCRRKDSSSDEDYDGYLETNIPRLQRQRAFRVIDIHYDFQIPNRFIQKNREIQQHKNEARDDTEFTVLGAENDLESSDSMLSDFDFGYNYKRDKWLLAMNALKTFVDDKDMPKYYNQRFRLFSKLNEGILMDREGWYSVTPERIAAHIADRVVIMKDTVVLDGFAGVGGNCIQFALKGAYVIALDMDPIRLRCAKRNAEIYGVADRINFICIDFFNFCKFHCEKVRQLKMEMKEKQSDTFRSLANDTSQLWKRRRVKKKVVDDFKQVQKATNNTNNNEFEEMKNSGDRKIEKNMFVEIDTDDEDDFGIVVDNCHYMPIFDAVLLSPPWGGPSYLNSKLFSLKNMEPKGDKIFRITRKLTHNIAYYLPRQTDVKELIRLSKDSGGMVEIEQAEVNRKVKAITAYYGELACDASW